MSVDDPTTKLLTLLNVSATKPGKRKRSGQAVRSAPLGGKRSDKVNDRVYEAAAVVAASKKGVEKATETAQHAVVPSSSSTAAIAAAPDSDDEGTGAASSSQPSDAFSVHFASEGPGSHAALLADLALPGSQWEPKVVEPGSSDLGKVVHFSHVTAKGAKGKEVAGGPHANVLASWHTLRKSEPPTAFQQKLMSRLSTYEDFYHSSLPIADRASARETIACHAVSHAIKTRRRILKNNERLAHAAADASSEDVEVPRDQGFTRPKVLILAPMRNSALEWVRLLERLSGCPQVDNKGRLEKEFNLPQGAVDKLTQPEACDRYPSDHLETFRGNIDDNFLLGVKLTRKSLKLFSAFYESDFIVASPLALRLAIEKDRGNDFLSSIEVLITDQMDVLAMQNWDHLQFVVNNLNNLPKESHDTDFSRVKQWYLDGQAGQMRQSILLSSYDSPEMRSLFSLKLANVAGKSRTISEPSGVMNQVKEGIRQTFTRIECANLQAEHDVRFNYFTQKTLPKLLKSALSASRTLLFVPSYFDFVRLTDYMTQEGMSFASLSEYSEGKEIARARQQFVAGKKNFLVVTERFHFYRRYVLRGPQTIVFYGLPEHKEYFVEALAFPFATSTSLVEALDLRPSSKKVKRSEGEDGQEEELELDPSDVSVVAQYTRYDLLRLQRIVGVDLARRMVEESRTTWRFT